MFSMFLPLVAIMLIGSQQPQKKPTAVGPTTSTPATDAENQPPTPIPSTPITPMAPASFSQPGGGAQSQAGTMQGVTSAAHTAAPAQQPPDTNSIAQFTNLEENVRRRIFPVHGLSTFKLTHLTGRL